MGTLSRSLSRFLSHSLFVRLISLNHSLFTRLISYRGGAGRREERRSAFPTVPSETENVRIGVGFRVAQPNLQVLVAIRRKSL